MRRNNILIVGLLLTAAILCGCASENSTTSTEESSVTIASTAATTTETTTETAQGFEAYKLTITKGDDLLIERPSAEYRAGETVVLKTVMVYDVYLVCEVNGEGVGDPKEIVGDDGHKYLEFGFVMPEQDVEVAFEFYDYNTNIAERRGE